MKKNTHLFLASCLCFMIAFAGCKKTDSSSDNSTDSAVQSDDQSRVASGTDDVANDANDIIGNYATFDGRPANLPALPCNATVSVDSSSTSKIITVTYNGNNCFGTRSRTGVVVLSMPRSQHWTDAGAVLTITSQNLKITRISDNKSITLNGAVTVTNVTGGRIYQLGQGSPSIIHDIAGNGVSVTFDNGSHRDWSISKRRTFSYNNGIVITTVGTHTENGISNISEWGTNRFGNPFTAAITNPMIIRQDCNFRLVSGQITHQGNLGMTVSTFGLDSQGNPTTCPGLTGFYYFKVVWNGVNGAVRTIIYPY